MSQTQRTNPRLLLVAHRFAHHAEHSGLVPLMRLLPGVPIEGSALAERVLGVPWHIPAIRHRLKSRGMQYYSAQNLRRELPLLLSMLRRRGGLIHFLFGEFDLLLVTRWARRLGWRMVATFHDTPTRLGQRLNLAQVRRLDGAFCVARCQLPFFADLLPADRVWFVPYGIDAAYFCPAANPEQYAPRCLCVGGYQRDFEMLAAVFAGLRIRFPEVKLIGVIPKQYHAALPDIPGIELKAGLSDAALREEYRAATMLLMPLQDSTANTAINEALACGLPIVTTDVGGTHDYLDERCAFLHPPGAVQDMVDSASLLLRDRELNLAMRRAARARGEALAWPHITAQILDVYREAFGFIP
jgi:glycosyltransferase involved in cell wall biosynthesis